MRSIGAFLEALWIFFIFMGCTLVFYYGILWVSAEYNDYHRYEEPKGRAVKVVQQHVDTPMLESSFERLRFFLRHGE
ncbi:YqzK family protein [Evansella sp. AB-rgal1]|uniref:YqzK family protein n=1 Tax=Evansella sp. AB-rgal1 TaxID=3242696 RepID=UPI00359F0C28